MQNILWFADTGRDALAQVGGKNSSLGEMRRELGAVGVDVPDGFSVTAAAYRGFLDHNQLGELIRATLADWPREDVVELQRRGALIREAFLEASFPPALARDIRAAYAELSRRAGAEAAHVAVRSSATAEDLPNASFAGQQESYLHVHGAASVLDHVRRCFASLFTARAIHYREDMGFDHLSIALSVGVQQMVRSDLACSGVMFTLDPDSGHPDFVYLTSAWGLGENVVQGRVVPDAYLVHKPTLALGFSPVVRRVVGSKLLRMVFDAPSHRVRNEPTPAADQARLTLSDAEVLTLARHALAIERHFSEKRGTETPMDIEWAKDGVSGKLFIVQARPETVHSQKKSPALKLYQLRGEGEVLVRGLAVGQAIASGRAHRIDSPEQMDQFAAGEVLITTSTDPDWEPILKRAAAVVTESGGRTSHAAIVSRELGIPAIVGAAGARERVASGQAITVSCAEGDEGKVYAGSLPFDVQHMDPAELRRTRTKVHVNLGDPQQALGVSRMPVDGVGLARMELILLRALGVHPMALIAYDTLPVATRQAIDARTAGYSDRIEFFLDSLAQGVGTLAAAFYPRPVILRFSDFKTNEYAHLTGGERFEPKEENPMIGWRGASRYTHPGYEPGFRLELRAVRRVRELYGLDNLHVMIPFCRTTGEVDRITALMEEEGLRRGEQGLKLYLMAEIPANVLLAAEFARHPDGTQRIDGFSIGSNDLTQLVLGVDRDSERVAPLFRENNPAVLRAIRMLLQEAHAAGVTVGICGQAPSDDPEFAAFLVEAGIDSISLTPDAIWRTVRRVMEVEGR